jgi:uncharacterized membrane protein
MKAKYYTLAGAAIAFAGSLLALQITGGLEYTAGASTYTVASMVGAMITVAILPVFIHLAGHLSRVLQAVLFVGFAAFLVYSLPATVGRVGEVKEGKALAARDASSLQAEMASLSQTLAYARPAMETECHGAPNPLPSDPARWPECRRKRGTVTAVEAQHAKLSKELREMGTTRLGDVGSDLLSWATGGKLAAESIRKGSGLGLPFGLEIAIWALVWLSTIAIQKGMSTGPVVHAPAVQAITERDFTQDPITPAEWDALIKYLKTKTGPVNNNELAEAVGISAGECSKRVKDAVNAGIMNKQRNGREVAITLH